MSSYLVLTATGRDRPGIVHSVTERIVAHKGNVEMSRMARLGGEFAMLVLVTIPEGEADAMLEDVRELEVKGLFVRARTTDPAAASAYAGHSPYDVRVEGADHPGIIHQITQELAQRNVNIETMDTSVKSAPLSGAPLFMMSALVFAPPDVLQDELIAAIDHLADELAVDIELTPHEAD